MTAAEHLRRAEQRATIYLHSGRGLLALATIVVLVVTYRLGVGQGRASQELEQVGHALENNAHALQGASLHRDSTKQAAVAAVAHTDSQRVQTRTARGRFAIVDSSTVSISAPVTSVNTERSAGDSVVNLVDSLFHVPPPVIAYIRQADLQIHDDSVTIARLGDDIRALEVKDSLHIERETLLERKVDLVATHARWQGATLATVAIIAARGAVWIFARR
jgi:hypothetical protein